MKCVREQMLALGLCCLSVTLVGVRCVCVCVKHTILYYKNILEAVNTIHKHGIVYIDLKPANCVIVNAWLKLIDFGIAKKYPTRCYKLYRGHSRHGQLTQSRASSLSLKLRVTDSRKIRLIPRRNTDTLSVL